MSQDLSNKRLLIPDITLNIHVIHRLRELAFVGETSAEIMPSLENYPGLQGFKYLRHAFFLGINETKDFMECSSVYPTDAMEFIRNTQPHWNDPELNATETRTWKAASEAVEMATGQSLSEFITLPRNRFAGIIEGTNYGAVTYYFYSRDRFQWEFIYLLRDNFYWDFVRLVQSELGSDVFSRSFEFEREIDEH